MREDNAWHHRRSRRTSTSPKDGVDHDSARHAASLARARALGRRPARALHASQLRARRRSTMPLVLDLRRRLRATSSRCAARRGRAAATGCRTAVDAPDGRRSATAGSTTSRGTRGSFAAAGTVAPDADRRVASTARCRRRASRATASRSPARTAAPRTSIAFASALGRATDVLGTRRAASCEIVTSNQQFNEWIERSRSPTSR